MRLERLTKAKVEDIYKNKMTEDFPKAELKPLEVILKAIDNGIYEPLGLFDDEKIIGYTFLAKLGRDYLVDYLAVYADSRNNGAGSNMVQLLADYLKDAGHIIGEVEDPDHATDTAAKDIQTRRLNFYMRNGCSDTGLRVECFGVPFRILRVGKLQDEDLDELWELYQEFYRRVLPKKMFEKNIQRTN
jgi:GNAT superfamily N-acetyltransferase